MFSKLRNIFTTQKKTYSPVRHTFFRDEHIADVLHKEGYCVVDFIDEHQQKALLELYNQHHQLGAENPGVFFGALSKNKGYIKIVHQAASEILAPSFDRWLKEYKCVISNFVIKTPGEATSVPVHQDGAALDELKYSSINIWTPLQVMTNDNGVLSIIPRSHNIFYPYRCDTTPPITCNIEEILHPYFQPIYLNFGQALFFDSRLFHFSKPNRSRENRVAIVSRITPKEASIMAYYKDEVNNNTIEAYECSESFLIDAVNYNDKSRPTGVRLMEKIKSKVVPLSAAEFEKKRLQFGICAQNIVDQNRTYRSSFIDNM